MNEIKITGNLGANPEIKITEMSKFAYFYIAHNIKRKQAGKTLETADWHRVVVFNDYVVDVVVSKLQKGSHVQVEGQLRNRKFTKEDGTSTTVTEIVLDQYNGRIEILHQSGIKDSKFSEEDILAA